MVDNDKENNRYLFQEPNKITHTWNPLAQYNSELGKGKAHSPLPCRNWT